MKHSLLFAFGLVLSCCSASHAQGISPWVETTGPSNIKCFAASGDTSSAGGRGDTIFGGGPSGLSFSPDNGTTWISSGFDSVSIVALAIFEGKVFAGTSSSGLFVSTNSGVNWVADTAGLTGATEVSSLAVSAPNIVAATSNGISVSTDGGASWTQKRSAPYATLTSDGTNVYASDLLDQSFFASTDNGMTWTVGAWPGFAASLAATNGDVFAALGTGEGVVRSTNSGTSWLPVNNGGFDSSIGSGEFNCHFLLVYGQNLFMASDSGIFLTTNLGALWIDETPDTVTIPGTGQFFVNTVIPWNGNLFAGTNDSIWVCPLSKLIGLASVNSAEASNASFTAYPNPFAQSTTINFSTSESGLADVSVVNILGTPVARIFSGQLDPGAHSFTWDASGLAQGMYECIISMNGNVKEIPIMLAR
jgi:hypothetical protein